MSDKPPDQIERLQSEVAALRELMNVYNLGGWTDSERLMRERNEARAELAALRADGVDARRWQAFLRMRAARQIHAVMIFPDADSEIRIGLRPATEDELIAELDAEIAIAVLPESAQPKNGAEQST